MRFNNSWEEGEWEGEGMTGCAVVPSGGGDIKCSKDSFVDGHLRANFHTCWHKNLSVRQELSQTHGVGWEI